MRDVSAQASPLRCWEESSKASATKSPVKNIPSWTSLRQSSQGQSVNTPPAQPLEPDVPVAERFIDGWSWHALVQPMGDSLDGAAGVVDAAGGVGGHVRHNGKIG